MSFLRWSGCSRLLRRQGGRSDGVDVDDDDDDDDDDGNDDDDQAAPADEWMDGKPFQRDPFFGWTSGHRWLADHMHRGSLVAKSASRASFKESEPNL